MNKSAVIYALASAALFGVSTPAAKVLVGAIARDPATGEIKAVARTDLPNWSGVLATAGLVFTGLWEGALVAYDPRTLQEVWRFDTGCGVMAPPISYAVNGKQYIAVAAGPHWLGQKPVELKFANPCSMLYVFSL
jgi:alcohol dehydrogenase (cytochrome c)